LERKLGKKRTNVDDDDDDAGKHKMRMHNESEIKKE